MEHEVLEYLKSWVSKLIPQKLKDQLWIFQNDSQPPIAEIYTQEKWIGTGNKDKHLIFIESLLSDITDKSKIDTVVSYSKEFYEAENERQTVVESKASILLGFAGTLAAIFIGVLTFLFDSQIYQSSHIAFKVLILIILFSIISFLGICIVLAMNILGSWVYHQLNIKTILKINSKAIVKYQSDIAARYIYASINNNAINNRKYNNYIYSQIFLTISIFLVLLLSCLSSVYFTFSSVANDSSNPTISSTAPATTISNTVTLSLTQTLATNSVTQTPFPTATLRPTQTNIFITQTPLLSTSTP